MKYVRFSCDGKIRYGIWEGGEIRVLAGDLFGVFTLTDERYPSEAVRLLAPCQPAKAVCLGLNYHDHAREMNLALPAQPLLFLKPSSAVIGPEDTIVYPPETKNLHYEAELAIVIGKTTKRVTPDQASLHILGYTCANDVTARDLQHADGQWTRAKSFDTFLPLGPCIATDIDAGSRDISLYLNGERRQHSNTRELIFPIPEIVSFVSRVMTLYPGDVILTGTPSGVGPMQPGDMVEVVINGIGWLKNRVGVE